MLKRILTLCIALCLSIVLTLPLGLTVSANGSLSSDTVVTKENADQIMEYLGLDPSNLVSSDTISDDSVEPVTLGELQQALVQLEQSPKEVITTENFNSLATQTNSNFCTGLKMLYYTTNLGGSFDLSYEVAANYSWNKYTSANNATVSVNNNTDNPLISFTIASKDVGAKVISNGEKVEMKATVKVDSWLTLFNTGLVKVTTTTVNTTKEWNTTQGGIPGCI